jgi:hypothetical protein
MRSGGDEIALLTLDTHVDGDDEDFNARGDLTMFEEGMQVTVPGVPRKEVHEDEGLNVQDGILLREAPHHPKP